MTRLQRSREVTKPIANETRAQVAQRWVLEMRAQNNQSPDGKDSK